MNTRRIALPRVIFPILMLFLLISSSSAMQITTGTPDTWYVLGTSNSTSPYQFPFILGDNDGYTTGDSCEIKWYGYHYDYDYAIQKYVFKAPFEITITGIRFSPTSSGYNLLYIACLKSNATMDMFTSCQEEPPFTLNLSNGVISIGARWEAYGKVCVNAGKAHREYDWCLSNGADQTTSWKIIFDETGHVKIYYPDDISGSLVAEGDPGTCESGWYMILIKDFDSTISVEEPIYISSSEIKELSELPLPLNGTQEESQNGTTCMSEEEIQERISQAYNEGYEAGIEFCKQNPDRCGLEIEPPELSNCAYYNPLNNELVIPCFSIGVDQYELKLQIIDLSNGVTLRLSDYRKK